MTIYQAQTKDGFGIVTVIANDEDEARERVRQQLDRPGRRFYLRRWQKGGEIVNLKDHE